uniref:Hepatocyte growth factor-regulated tyrosine kinase substrate n=1 Tax=Trichuris muris TaxID=70415 RepID=A0A5S6QYU6_TRIMR
MMSKRFERCLDKATDSTLLEADWELIMSCTDAVRSGEVPPKVALSSVRKRIHSDNPHVAHHALTVLEALVKNCGQPIHKEVATKEVMEDLKHLTSDCPDKVKDKILELIQCWAHAFRENPEYRIVKDTHNLMKLEGHVFPILRESDAMFMSEVAPEWVDANHCSRCRIQFTLITRKHHCRNCGQIFCDKCSGKSLPLPHIGIEKDVRVCETCFDKIKNPPPESQKKVEPSQAEGKSKSTTGEKSEADLQEEEELQLALALSQSEAEEKERLRRKVKTNYFSSTVGLDEEPLLNGMERSTVIKREPEQERDTGLTNEAESELAHYLNRQYWEKVRTEQRQLNLRQSPTPSAPVAVEADVSLEKDLAVNAQNSLQNGAESLDDFVAALNERLNAFVNRVKSNQARGRSVITDTALQNTFMSLTSMHSELLKHLQELDDRRGYFETLQDKVAQVRDAREALDALRAEHVQKKEAELYELQQMRHMQMLAKLEAMRIQKHEMLEQQRLAAIRKMEEEQLEMQMRKRMIPQQFQSNIQGYATGIPANPTVPPHCAPQVQPSTVPVDAGMQQAVGNMVHQQIPFPPAMFPCVNMGDLAVNGMVPPKALHQQANPTQMGGVPAAAMHQASYAQPQFVMGSYVPPPMAHDGHGGFPYPTGFVGSAPASSSPYAMNPVAMTLPPLGYGMLSAPPVSGVPMSVYARSPPVNYGMNGQQPAVPMPGHPAAPEQPAEAQLITFD